MKTQIKNFKILQNYGAMIALIILILGISIISPGFRTMNNFFVLLRQSSINGLIAFGMTLVILTGGIDLSVGSTLALTAALTAGFITHGIPVPLAILIAIIIGIFLGSISGTLVTKGKIQPFIATLITMTIYRGMTLIYTDRKPISNLGNNFLLNFIGRGNILGIPVPVIIFLLAFLIIYLMLNKTALGRKIYAVGSNSENALLAGIKIDKIKLIVYSISGLTATLSGLILLSRLGSAQPTLGIGFELDAIAAVAIGGTSMSGGRGKIQGTLIGILIIAVLNNGFNVLGINSNYQEVVKGIVILIAVLSDRKK